MIRRTNAYAGKPLRFAMTSAFAYTGLRVRDLDKAIDFFTGVMGMRLQGRHKSDWTKGEFAILFSKDGKHWLELNWYAPDSPIEGPFREGDELDHLGFEVDDLPDMLARLKQEGYEPRHSYEGGGWRIAFVPVVDGIWLDLFHRPAPRKRKAAPGKKTASRRSR